MSEMMKRVTEAIKECDADHCADMSQFWMVHARAAIEAMREPTQEMLDAVDISIPTLGMIISPWHQMIDAALATEQEPANV